MGMRREVRERCQRVRGPQVSDCAPWKRGGRQPGAALAAACALGAPSIPAGAGRVKPIVTAELDPPRPAPRPANSVLAPLAWRGAGFDDLRPWRDGLANNLKRLSQVN